MCSELLYWCWNVFWKLIHVQFYFIMQLIYGNKSSFVDCCFTEKIVEKNGSVELFKTQREKKESIFGEGTLINHHTTLLPLTWKLKGTNIVWVLAKRHPVWQQIWTFGPKKENILCAFTSNIHCIIIIELWDYWVKVKEVSSLLEEKVVINSPWWAHSAKHKNMI